MKENKTLIRPGVTKRETEKHLYNKVKLNFNQKDGNKKATFYISHLRK